MCYFLAIGVRKDGAALLSREKSVPHRGEHLDFQPALNSSLAAIFPAQDQIFWVTSGMCSCSFHSYRSHENSDSLRQRYKSKGWSDAKIARALEQGSAAKAKHRFRNNKSQQLFYGLVFRLTVCDGGVRMFWHFYHGEPNREEVTSASHSGISIDALSLGESLPDDTLVAVRAAETNVQK